MKPWLGPPNPPPLLPEQRRREGTKHIPPLLPLQSANAGSGLLIDSFDLYVRSRPLTAAIGPILIHITVISSTQFTARKVNEWIKIPAHTQRTFNVSLFIKVRSLTSRTKYYWHNMKRRCRQCQCLTARSFDQKGNKKLISKSSVMSEPWKPILLPRSKLIGQSKLRLTVTVVT